MSRLCNEEYEFQNCLGCQKEDVCFAFDFYFSTDVLGMWVCFQVAVSVPVGSELSTRRSVFKVFLIYLIV